MLTRVHHGLAITATQVDSFAQALRGRLNVTGGCVGENYVRIRYLRRHEMETDFLRSDKVIWLCPRGLRWGLGECEPWYWRTD